MLILPPPFLTTTDFFFLFFFFYRSSSGIVNIYDSTSYSLSSSEISKTPKPIKSIGNLTTAISSLKFNHDAQLLVMASREKKDSMRLVRFSLVSLFFQGAEKIFFMKLFFVVGPCSLIDMFLELANAENTAWDCDCG